MGKTSDPKSTQGGAKKKWTPFRHDPFGAKFVHVDFKKALSNRLKKFKTRQTAPNIRVPARKFAHLRWGSGLDEMVQTRLLRTNPKKFPVLELGELHQRERMHTTDLIWATGPKGRSPLAGHTPALKPHPKKALKGVITEEHGTRDALRKKAIMLEDSSVDWGIKARLATIKYMMSPGEQLMAQLGRLKKLSKPVFSAFKDIGDLRKREALGKLANRQQELRERLKWHTAREMLSSGHEKLVPDIFQTYLKKHTNPTDAMGAFSKDALSKKVGVNAKLSSQTDDLSSQKMSTMTIGRKRALSDPRLPVLKLTT